MNKLGNDQVIEAAGGLVWREEPAGKKIAIIHRTRYGDEWTLPKGKKQKKDKTLEETAKREVKEEIGWKNPKIESFAGKISYPVTGKTKVVYFWNMTMREDWNFRKTKEVDRIQWVSISEALTMLDHAKERALLKKALIDTRGK